MEEVGDHDIWDNEMLLAPKEGVLREVAERLIDVSGLNALPAEARQLFADFLVCRMPKRFGKRLLPASGESLALSVMRPKTAALAFDRVYRIPCLSNPVPESIAFYGGTLPEMTWWSAALLAKIAIDHGFDNLLNGPADKSACNERENLRFVCLGLDRAVGAYPTIFYERTREYRADYPVGGQQVLAAAISNVALVDERSLTWEQVLDFRQDIECRTKYRRVLRWINMELASRSPAEVEDSIAIALDDYEWSLKKHGIKAAIGGLSSILDPSFLGTTSATIAGTALLGSGALAALAGTGLAVGKALLTFSTQYIDGLDERRRNNYEMAYIHEVQQLPGS